MCNWSDKQCDIARTTEAGQYGTLEQGHKTFTSIVTIHTNVKCRSATAVLPGVTVENKRPALSPASRLSFPFSEPKSSRKQNSTSTIQRNPTRDSENSQPTQPTNYRLKGQAPTSFQTNRSINNKGPSGNVDPQRHSLPGVHRQRLRRRSGLQHQAHAWNLHYGMDTHATCRCRVRTLERRLCARRTGAATLKCWGGAKKVLRRC